MSGSIYTKQLQSALAGRYHLAAVDLPGHGQSGRSPNPEQDYTPAGLAEAVCDDLRAGNFGPVVLVGHSYGAHIALKVASAYAQTKGVMMVGAAPVRATPTALQAVYNMLPAMRLVTTETFSEAEIAEWARHCFAGSTGPTPDFLLDDIRRCDGRHRGVLGRSIQNATILDEVAYLAQSPLPFSFVLGEAEPLVKFEALAAILTDLNRPPLTRIANAGHTPFWDNPTTFDSVLAEFVATCR